MGVIDKEEFYYGAALRLLLHHAAVKAVCQDERFGYLVNNENFITLKYASKSRSPWQFSFDQEDINKLQIKLRDRKTVTLGLICGGDGICALSLKQLNIVLGNTPGTVSVRRPFRKQYSVKGTAGKLPGKITQTDWPRVIVEGNA